MHRIEGLDKLIGRERYIDDLPLGPHLWGATVRFPAARGTVREIRFGDGVDWSEFVVVDHRDIPGNNSVRLIELDQPVLVEREGRHVHEAVLLLAHESRTALRRALPAVEVVVDPLEPALDFTAAPRPGQAQHGTDNVLARLAIDKGDVTAATATAAHVIEREYGTGAQEHLYIEPQGMAAWRDGDVLVVAGSMQCPYYVLNALTWALGRDETLVRVIQCPTGGGFGGKEDFPSVLAVHVALLALAANRPVKMIYDRAEDMAATPKRHPARIRHRTAIDAAGRLLAQDIEVTLDAGAYATLSPVVLSRAIIHAVGPYRCDNVRVRGRAVLTNSVPSGAFRGFGATQTQFATERQMDLVADAVGADPVAIRQLNLLRDGDSTATGQVISDGADRHGLLLDAIAESHYEKRLEECSGFNDKQAYLRRGVGISMSWHGGGFTGGGEARMRSRAKVEGLEGGRVRILTAATEFGQGTDTVLTQIAADHLGLDPGDVSIAPPDTAVVPNSGPTVASRTVMIVGRLLRAACDDLLRALGLPTGARGETVRAAITAWHDRSGGDLVGVGEYDAGHRQQWDDRLHVGEAYEAYSWGACVAEVEVDLRTFTARVIDVTVAHEIGKVIHETLARGQVQGGVAQAIGWALTEQCHLVDGAMTNDRMNEYSIPTAMDVPPIRVLFPAYTDGTCAPKGLGELPIDGPAPAIANAISRALATEANTLPLTPSRLMALVLT